MVTYGIEITKCFYELSCGKFDNMLSVLNKKLVYGIMINKAHIDFSDIW